MVVTGGRTGLTWIAKMLPMKTRRSAPKTTFGSPVCGPMKYCAVEGVSWLTSQSVVKMTMEPDCPTGKESISGMVAVTSLQSFSNVRVMDMGAGISGTLNAEV